MTDEEKIQNARTKGFGRCLAALARFQPTFRPPHDNRPDPLEGERLRAQKIARRLFRMPDVDLDKVAKVVTDMKNWLASPSLAIIKAKPGEKECGFREGFVANNRPPIVLCPFFFEQSEEQQIRCLIHEAAHLAGIGEASGESYYVRYNCANDGGMVHKGSVEGDGRGGPTQADTWGHFVHCVLGLPKDPDDVVRPDPDAPPPTPPTPALPAVHIVVYGDYLVKLAKQYYGNGALWPRIYHANRMVIGPNPDKIFPGQRLVIP